MRIERWLNRLPLAAQYVALGNVAGRAPFRRLVPFAGQGLATDSVWTKLLYDRIRLSNCCQHFSSVFVFVQYYHELESVVRQKLQEITLVPSFGSTKLTKCRKFDLNLAPGTGKENHIIGEHR